MSNEADRAIKNVLEEHGESWTQATVWRVQGTAVISHKALERIAARAGIRFDLPTVIRAERDEAVMLVVGHRGDQREWSVGECVINQNYKVSGKQAAYPWAMSEKRAKDRVILKLLQLHGLAYSEEEADDFRTSNAKDAPVASPEMSESSGDEPTPFDDDLDERHRYIAECRDRIRTAKDGKPLTAWWQSDEQKRARRDFELSQDEVDSLKTALADRLQALGANSQSTPPRKANGNDHSHHEGARQ